MAYNFDTLPFTVISKNAREINLGLVTLSTDLTIENEMQFFLGDGKKSLLHSRIKSKDEVNTSNLREMKEHFKECLSLFPPNHKFDVIGYGCTSGALMIGDQEIQKIIKSNIPVREVTSPLIAVKRALKFLNVKKLGFLAPYNSEISQKMCQELEEDQISILAAVTFDEPMDSIVGNISPQSILQALSELKNRDNTLDLDAVFVSCTGLKCSSIISKAESQLKIPVLSSNSVLAWDMARLCRLSIGSDEKGILFQTKVEKLK